LLAPALRQHGREQAGVQDSAVMMVSFFARRQRDEIFGHCCERIVHGT